MKFLKKTYSLVTKETWNVINSLMFLSLGIFKLVNPQNPAGKLAIKILAWLTLAEMLFGIVFRLFAKFDMEDEAALEHYDRAKKKVFDFILGFFAGAAVVVLFIGMLADTSGFITNISINVNTWHFLIICELLQLAVSLFFIYYEKREA